MSVYGILQCRTSELAHRVVLSLRGQLSAEKGPPPSFQI